MIRSLIRPVTNSSPSWRKPRSPVRRNGPRRRVGQGGAERRRGRLGGALPVARGDARAADPDLADCPSSGHRGASPGSTITITSVGDVGPAAADQRCAHAVVGRRTTSGRRRRSSASASTARRRGSRAAAGRRPSGWPRPGRSRDRTPSRPESARREGCRKRLDRLGAHRLGAVEGDPPAAQVERLAICSGVILRTQRS